MRLLQYFRFHPITGFKLDTNRNRIWIKATPYYEPYNDNDLVQ